MTKNQLWQIREGLDEYKKDLEAEKDEIIKKMADLKTKRANDKIYFGAFISNKELRREVNNMIWLLDREILMMGS